MTSIRIRDPYGNVREVDASARPFWEGREGYQILAPLVDAPAPVEPANDPKTSKAAVRPAQNKEA